MNFNNIPVEVLGPAGQSTNQYSNLKASDVSSQISALNALITPAGGILIGTKDVASGDLINLELLTIANYNTRLAAATATEIIS